MTADTQASPPTDRPDDPPGHPRLRQRGRRADHARPDPLVHRLRRGVDRAHRRPGRQRHVHPPRPREEAELASTRAPTPPTSRASRTAPTSARVDEKDAGPTNNWMDPDEMKDIMRGLYAGCMKGRTMYVIPFVMGHLEAEKPMFGVEITDSAYVTASMRVMARMGTNVLRRMEELDAAVRARRCTRSACRSSDGQADVAWPCNDTKYIVQFPEERAIWSFGSGLRRQRAARQEVLRPAHRQRDGPRRGLAGRAHADPQAHLARRASPSTSPRPSRAPAARPTSPCSSPTIPGWKVESIGDDIAWMRIGEDGRLWAVNPEYGFFGVAPGTNEHTNPNAMRTINKGNSVFTNVALTDDGDIWWEGLENTPAHATSLEGRALDPRQRRAVQPPEQPLLHADQAVPDPRPGVRRPARRPDRRDPLRRSPQDHDPAGDRGPRLGPRHVHGRDALARRPPPPPSARSASCAATRWRCCRSSATTPATTSTTGSRSARTTTRPSCRGSSTSTGSAATTTATSCGPGFGENSRVLKWVIERIEGQAAAVETPIGHVPAPGSLDIDGPRHDPGAARRPRSRSTPRSGRPRSRRSRSGSRSSATQLPAVLWTELDGLKARLGA